MVEVGGMVVAKLGGEFKIAAEEDQCANHAAPRIVRRSEP